MPLIADAADAAQFATADDLADRLGVELTSAEQARATALLARASQLVRDAARQPIEQVVDDVLTMRGTNEGRILLPARPVASVASVKLNGTTLDDWYLDGNVLVGRFGHSCDTLEITYTHGYETPPATVQTIVLEAVVRVWVNPGAVVGERHGSEQVQYMNGTPTGLLLTDAEQRAIRRLFGRRGGSVSQS